MHMGSTKFKCESSGNYYEFVKLKARVRCDSVQYIANNYGILIQKLR